MAILNPYISYESAKEALAYYEDVFSAENIFRLPLTKEQAEGYNIPDENLNDTTMHGGFTVLGVQIYVSDFAAGSKNSEDNNITLMVEVDNDNEDEIKAADDFYLRLHDSNQVEITMPYAEQFWGGKMGAFTDKYGVKWMLHLPPKEVDKSAFEEA